VRLFKKAAAGLLGLVALLVVIVLGRTLMFRPRPVVAVPLVELAVDAEAAAQRLAKGITFPTVSNQDKKDNEPATFVAYQEYLARTYPAVHKSLHLEKIGGLSLVYTWKGKDLSKPPVVLMGHQDVVPVAPGTEKDWGHAPFSGDIADGYIWGRGALDDKVMVQAILEAVEALLAQQYQPARTIYLAFGHDEEVGGVEGMKLVVQWLRKQGVNEVALVLDEGLPMAAGLFPGIDSLTALIGVAEKGYVSLELGVDGDGGHSAMPPPHSNIGILAQAIRRLEENPFPLQLTPVVEAQFERLGPDMPFKSRLVLANRWLFKGLLLQTLARQPKTAAFVRTTTAATMFNAGVKDNVLPMQARAVVNFRILPGETVTTVTRRVHRLVADERVRLRVLGAADDPSPVSDPRGPPFQLIEQTIRETWGTPDLKVAPILIIGATDAKHFSSLSRNIFRLTAVRVESPADTARWHGTNERVPLKEYAKSIGFFQLLIKRFETL